MEKISNVYTSSDLLKNYKNDIRTDIKENQFFRFCYFISGNDLTSEEKDILFQIIVMDFPLKNIIKNVVESINLFEEKYNLMKQQLEYIKKKESPTFVDFFYKNNKLKYKKLSGGEVEEHLVQSMYDKINSILQILQYIKENIKKILSINLISK